MQGARCANCKNLKELHKGYQRERFGVRVKAEATCDDWEPEPSSVKRNRNETTEEKPPHL